MTTEPRLLLCADLDRTLLPKGTQPESPSARRRFRALGAHPDIVLVYVTGRDRRLILRAMSTYSLPKPDLVVSDVGTNIYDLREGAWVVHQGWQAAIAPDQVFDPRLHTYYDDVDIASRLRAAGHGARVIPAARAFHAGGASSASLSSWRYRQLTCNRLLVLARLLGRSFWIRLPIVLLPDLKTLGRAIRRRETVAACGIRQGWRRAATLLRFFTHGGPPLVPLAELARFRLSEPPTSKTS